MNSEESVALGIDIGGTGVKLGFVTRAGEVSAFRTFPTAASGADPAPFLARLKQATTALLGAAPAKVMGVGISTHGYIDDERRGPIACASTPALRGVDLRGTLERWYGLPTVLNNDLTAHALAEYHFGSGRGARRFMALAVGTGLGAGVIMDGRPLRFLGGAAGDTGRVLLQPGGPKCGYGVSGSAEALCGVAEIERLAHQRYGHAVVARTVIEAARQGEDAVALGIMRVIGTNLGHAAAILSAIFLPERIALTGGTAAAGPVLLEACRVRFEELMGDYNRMVASLTGAFHQGVEIVLGETGQEAGVLGAVVELFEENQL